MRISKFTPLYWHEDQPILMSYTVKRFMRKPLYRTVAMAIYTRDLYDVNTGEEIEGEEWKLATGLRRTASVVRDFNKENKHDSQP